MQRTERGLMDGHFPVNVKAKTSKKHTKKVTGYCWKRWEDGKKGEARACCTVHFPVPLEPHD